MGQWAQRQGRGPLGRKRVHGKVKSKYDTLVESRHSGKVETLKEGCFCHKKRLN